jgi:predicted O-methyltransferase YrrM
MTTPIASPRIEYRNAAARIAKIPGFLVPGQEQWLFEKVNSLPNDAVVVEIGSLYGRSSCAMGFACVGTGRRVLCIDPWKYAELGDLDFFDRWRANVAATRLDAHVMPLRGRSHDVLARWKELTGGLPIDFIFIDGWHEFASVLRDFELAFPLVRTGGWIALHDVCPEWPGPLGVWEQTAAPSLSHHERCSTIACGKKDANRIIGQTGVAPTSPQRTVQDVHYFTELRSADDLSRQLDTLRRLDFSWRWHLIVGKPSPEARAIASHEPRVSVHVPSSPGGWSDRTEALSSVLGSIPNECVLWRIEPDDLWLPQQLSAGRAMLVAEPRKTALAVHTSAGLRPIAWHCHPWFRWTNAADPFLAAFLADGTVVDVGRTNPIVIEQAARISVAA